MNHWMTNQWVEIPPANGWLIIEISISWKYRVSYQFLSPCIFSKKKIEMNWIFRANTWEIEVLSSFSVVLSWLGQTCAAVSEAAALVSLHYSSISGSCAKESLLNSRGERTCSCSAYSKLCLISSNFQTISVKFQKSMPFDELQGGPTS